MPTNRVPHSPITLSEDRQAWRSIPEVPVAVQDGFGRKGLCVLQAGRWRGLIYKDSAYVFAWLDGRAPKATALTTTHTSGQTFESDADGRALVIGTGGHG